MAEDKEQRIWNEIKRRAKELIRFGEQNICLKIQDGQIVKADILQEKVSIV